MDCNEKKQKTYVTILKHTKLEEYLETVSPKIKLLLLNYSECAPNDTWNNDGLLRCWLSLKYVNTDDLKLNLFDLVVYEVINFLPNPSFTKQFAKTTQFVFLVSGYSSEWKNLSKYS